MKSYNEYNSFIASEVQPLINDYEENRKKNVKQVVIKSIFSVITFILFCILFLKYAPNFFPPEYIEGNKIYLLLLNFAVAPFIFLALFPFRIETKLYEIHNTKIYQKMNSFFEQFTQISGEVFTKEEMSVFNDILPINDGTSFYSNFTGKIDDINVKISNVKCRASSGKSVYTKFEGIIIKFSTNKKISGKVLVVKNYGNVGNYLKDSFEIFNGNIFSVFSNSIIKNLIPRVELDFQEFEKNYKIYGTNKAEVEYILTPDLMEGLLKINKKIFNKLTFAFAENSIYLTLPVDINYPQSFSMFEEISYRASIKSTYKNFSLIHEIIDILKLKDDKDS